MEKGKGRERKGGERENRREERRKVGGSEAEGRCQSIHYSEHYVLCQ